jgi:hypothetical protein
MGAAPPGSVLPPGYPSDYPPPPPAPPPEPPPYVPPAIQQPAQAPYGAPYPYPQYPYAPPAYGLPLSPARSSSRRLWLLVGGILAVLVVILAFGGYGVAAYSATNARISAAHHAIAAAADHRTTFDNTPTAFIQGSGDATAFTNAAKAFVSNRKMGEQQWLTFLGQGRLDQWSQQLAHARKALAAAATMADDRIKEGQFMQAFATAIADAMTLSDYGQAGDLVSAAAAATKLSTDAGIAIQLSNAPGLPPEVHQFMVQYKQLADDLLAYIQASIKGDKTTADQFMTAVNGDDDALQAISTDNVESEIAAYYLPFIKTYHAELTLAQG